MVLSAGRQWNGEILRNHVLLLFFFLGGVGSDFFVGHAMWWCWYVNVVKISISYTVYIYIYINIWLLFKKTGWNHQVVKSIPYHIFPYPRHPKTTWEGIWTLKTYLKHRTSGGFWMLMVKSLWQSGGVLGDRDVQKTPSHYFSQGIDGGPGWLPPSHRIRGTIVYLPTNLPQNINQMSIHLKYHKSHKTFKQI